MGTYYFQNIFHANISYFIPNTFKTSLVLYPRVMLEFEPSNEYCIYYMFYDNLITVLKRFPLKTLSLVL